MDSRTIEPKIDHLLAIVSELRAEVKSLRALIEASAFQSPQPRERPDELVDAVYVARLFNCKVSSVRAGKAGTRGIVWVSRRPLKCTRAEAHRAVRGREERARERAKRRVPSLVRRKKRF